MNTIKITLASLALALGTFAAQAQTPEQVMQKYTEAGEKINAKAYADAVPLLEQVITEGEAVGEASAQVVAEAKKFLPGMYFRAGGANVQSKNYEQAIEYFRKAVDAGDKYSDQRITDNAKMWIGRTYEAMGATAFNSKDYSAAAEIFRNGYEVAPTNTTLALNLAMSYGEIPDFEKAYNVYNDIMALDGSKYGEQIATAKEKLSYYKMIEANGAIASRDFSRALGLLEESVSVDTENALAYMLLIQTANNAKNYDKVIATAEKAAAVQTDANHKSTVYFLLGAAYENKSNNAKAIESYRKVTSGPNVATAKAQITALQE